MASNSQCFQRWRWSLLNPNAPEFVPQIILSDLLRCFEEPHYRQNTPTSGDEKDTDYHDHRAEQRQILSGRRHQSRAEHDCAVLHTPPLSRIDGFIDSPISKSPCSSNTSKTDIVWDTVRNSLRIRNFARDVSELIVQFARAQYEFNPHNTLLHEAYWVDTNPNVGMLDLRCTGSCAWIHPNLPPGINQNFQVTFSVAFESRMMCSEFEDSTYNAMSESEDYDDLFDHEFESPLCAMDLDMSESFANEMDLMDLDFNNTEGELRRICGPAPSKHESHVRCGRILSESLVSPRWEILCKEDADTSGQREICIEFNLWTHTIALDGQRDFLKNSVRVSLVVHDNSSQFEWHDITASWSAGKMVMSVQTKAEFVQTPIRGFIPFQPVVYGNSTYRSREIAVGKDILLSDDDEFKFFGFIQQIAVDVWND